MTDDGDMTDDRNLRVTGNALIVSRSNDSIGANVVVGAEEPVYKENRLSLFARGKSQ